MPVSKLFKELLARGLDYKYNVVDKNCHGHVHGASGEFKLKHAHSLFEKNKKGKQIHNHQGHIHDHENNPF